MGSVLQTMRWVVALVVLLSVNIASGDTAETTSADESGKNVGADESGKHVGADESGKHVGADESGKNVAADESGKHVGADESGKHVGADESGKNVAAKESGKRNEPLWLRIIGNLPVGWHVKVGLSAAWAYATSEKGNEIESVTNEVFRVIPGITKKENKFKAGEQYNPFNLGHICWSKGKSEGLNTIFKDGKVEKVTQNGKTWYELKFYFEELKFITNKCGFKLSQKKNSGSCVLDVGKAVFKVKFTVDHIDSYKNMMIGLLKKQCMLTIIDARLVELNGFKVDITNNEQNTGSHPLLQLFINKNKNLIQDMITVLGRVNLYRELKTSGSICKDPELDVTVKSMYAKYMAFEEKKMKPYKKTRTPTFHELCGNGKKQPANEKESSEEEGAPKHNLGDEAEGVQESPKPRTETQPRPRKRDMLLNLGAKMTKATPKDGTGTGTQPRTRKRDMFKNWVRPKPTQTQ